MSSVPVAGASGTAVGGLHEALSLLPDPRGTRGRVYPLVPVLLLCLVALLHGCQNPSHIFTFGRLRPALLRRLGFCPPKRRRGKSRPWPQGELRCPNEDTIATLLGSVDPARFNEAIARWIARLLPQDARAAVDGKALCGTEEHVLEVFVNDIRLVAWQMPVEEKANELSTLEQHIGEVLARYPQLRLLTGDAMFCQKTVARAIVTARRHYFLQLKSPHKTDVGTARDALTQLSRTPALATSEGKRGALRKRAGDA